jgi:hypothetical protein
MQLEEKSKILIMNPLQIRQSFLVPQLRMDPSATSNQGKIPCKLGKWLV